MSPTATIFAVNIFSTLCLVGLIWTVQLVHYPAFAYVDQACFRQFEAFHQRRISVIVLPLMLMELATSLLLLRFRPDFMPGWMAFTGVMLVAIIWVSTFALQAPLHQQLSLGKDLGRIKRLVVTNWIRSISWLARGLLLFWLLLNASLAENLAG